MHLILVMTLALVVLSGCEACVDEALADRVRIRARGRPGADSINANAFDDTFALFFDGDEDGVTGEQPEYCTLADADTIECDTEDRLTVCVMLLLTDCIDGGTCDDFVFSKGDNTNIGWDILAEFNATAFSYATRNAIDALGNFEQYGPFTQNRWHTHCSSYDGSIGTAADRLRGFHSACDSANPPVCGAAAESSLVSSLGTIPATLTNDSGASAAMQFGGVAGGTFNLGGGISEAAMWCAGQMTATQIDDCVLNGSNKWNDISPTAMSTRTSGGTACSAIFTEPRVWFRADPDTGFPGTITNLFGPTSGAGDLTCTNMEAEDRRQNAIESYFNIQSLQLDGTDDVIQVADSASLDDDLNNMSLCMWLRGTLNTIDGLFWKNAAGGRSFALRIDDIDPERIELCIPTAVGDAACGNGAETTADVLADDVAAFVCAVYDGAAQNIDLYVNGAEVASTPFGTIPTARTNSTSACNIGSGSSGTGPLGPALIDEVTYWSSSLTADQVSTLCCGSTSCGGVCTHHARHNTLGISGLVSYWPIDFDGHTTATDRVGTNNGTYSGTTELSIVPRSP